MACPFDEERLYYNIDIYVEATAHNCDEYDLVGIGDFLQNLVSEIEAEIPEYKNTERMETTVCPVPEEQDVTRTCSRSNFRSLQEAPQQAQSTRKRRAGRKRYTYKGSGRCRRCKANNSDRRLRKKRGSGVTGEMVCQYADKARHAFEEVAAVELKANEEVVSLEEKAMECGSDLYLEKELLREAKQRLTWIRQSQQVAYEGSRKANTECNKASRSKSPRALKKCLNKARRFERSTTKALEQATTDYGEVTAISGSFFCDKHVQEPLDYDPSGSQQRDEPWEVIDERRDVRARQRQGRGNFSWVRRGDVPGWRYTVYLRRGRKYSIRLVARRVVESTCLDA